MPRFRLRLRGLMVLVGVATLIVGAWTYTGRRWRSAEELDPLVETLFPVVGGLVVCGLIHWAVHSVPDLTAVSGRLRAMAGNLFGRVAMRLTRSTIFSVTTFATVAIGVLALSAWLIGAIGRAREEARSAQCVGNLSQLGLALHNYEAAYGSLPPAYVADSHGRPLYSWRVVLMAYLEREEGWNDRQLTTHFRFDEPWDSPNNRRLHALRPPIYFCPSDPDRLERGDTSVVAVVGPRTLFPPNGGVRRLADIRDDPKTTVMLVESDTAMIHWMKPRDLDWIAMSFRVNDRSLPSISSPHLVGSYPGPHVLTADGRVATLTQSMSREVVQALLMIDDGATVPLRTGPR